jgi:hypothetical protein
MSKSKKGLAGAEISINGKGVSEKLKNALLGEEDRTYEITEAAIKDDFCNYSYEITEGTGIGDTHKITGAGIIDDDLRDAFNGFNVHLAIIMEVFKHSNIEVTNIDTVKNHELAHLFHVTAFKMKGSKEAPLIMLIGTQYVSSAGGRSEIKTHWIALDKFSSYKWFDELKQVADTAKYEVAEYKEGKCTPVEVEEEKEKPNPKQMSLVAANEGEKELDKDFADAAL